MNILWCTPFATDSAIGRFSALVTSAMDDRGHNVTILRTEQVDSRGDGHHASRLPIVFPETIRREEAVDQYDVIALNIGDNYPLHAGIFPYLGTSKTIGIFHDFYLFNLFNGYAEQAELNDMERFALVADVYPGYTQAQWVADHAARDDETPWQQIARVAATTPMTPWLAQKCSAAVAHSAFYIDVLNASCPGPTAVIPLAWTSNSNDVDSGVDRLQRPIAKSSGDGTHLKLLTFGILNANKCASRIIEALGSTQGGQGESLAGTVDYRLAGSISDDERDRLETLALRHGVKVTFLGRVSNEQLATELREADIVSCLRDPVLEGASASAIEAMLAGCTTLVCNEGFYTSLPDDVVTKVPARAGPEEIHVALAGLAGDSDRRSEIGQRAKAWASRQFTAKTYVREFEELVHDHTGAVPYIELAGRIGQLLSDLGLPCDHKAVSGIADVLAAMEPPSSSNQTSLR